MRKVLVLCATILASSQSNAGILFPAAVAPISATGKDRAAPRPGVVAISAPSSERAVLRSGTEVLLRLLEEVTTKGNRLRVGQRLRLETAEPLIVRGVSVIPIGSPAVAEITEVKNKGMWGKSGHLAGRILHLSVNGRQIRLSGAFDDKGSAGGGAAAAVSAFVFLPAGFFMTGTSATMPIGTVLKGFVDEDVQLQIATGAPGSMAVDAAVPLAVMAGPAQQPQRE